VSFLARLLGRAAVLAVLPVLAGLGGCATTVPAGAGGNPADPYEAMNRRVQVFNDKFDRALAEPVARGYNAVLPKVVRECIDNFFENLQEVANMFNAGLQAQGGALARDTGRFLINSTVGVAGCFDVARQVGIERNRQNFGVTLGKWGLPAGPYLVLPVLGPSTARQAVGLVPDYFVTDLVGYLRPVKYEYFTEGLRLVNDRADVVEASGLIDTAAIDRYEFLRDGYLQRLRSRVYDGNPPPAPPPEDPDAPDPAPAGATSTPPAPAPGNPAPPR
jgi:phospholipid-binding lipoprotein MlaA